MNDSPAPQVPNGLRRLRTLTNHSQGEFAALFGVRLLTFRQWELSKTLPQPRHLRNLAARLGLTPAELTTMLDTPAEEYVPPAHVLRYFANEQGKQKEANHAT